MDKLISYAVLAGIIISVVIFALSYASGNIQNSNDKGPPQLSNHTFTIVQKYTSRPSLFAQSYYGMTSDGQKLSLKYEDYLQIELNHTYVFSCLEIYEGFLECPDVVTQ